MKWFVEKAFDYSQDGIKIEGLACGAIKEIREDLADGLKAAGYIRLPTEAELASAEASAPAHLAAPAPAAPAIPEAQLDRLSKAGLLKLAAERGIVIENGANKDTILAALTAPVAAQPTGSDASDKTESEPASEDAPAE